MLLHEHPEPANRLVWAEVAAALEDGEIEDTIKAVSVEDGGFVVLCDAHLQEGIDGPLVAGATGVYGTARFVGCDADEDAMPLPKVLPHERAPAPVAHPEGL